MRTLLFALLFVASMAGATSAPCPTMSPANMTIVFAGAQSGCMTVSPQQCFVSEPVSFHISTFGYNFACEPHLFEWSFGDGTTGVQGQDQTHTYLVPGMFPVSVSIVNSQQQLTLTRNVNVWSVSEGPPLAVEGLFDFGRRVPRGYRFLVGNASGFGNWIWDFGDGTIERGPERQRSHVYLHGGTFIVSLSSELASPIYTVMVEVPVDRRRSVRH